MSGVRKESRNDSVAGSSTMMEPTMMEEGEEYFNTEEPSAEWTEPTACSQLCRMCATENEYLIPIFDGEGVEHQLGMKIEKHLPIRVHVDDTLPLQVCYQCASTLIAWHDLVVGCIEAEKKLRQLQHQGEPQEEDIEDVKTCDTAMFYEDPTGTEPANDPIDTEPSTSASTHVQIRLPPKKTVPKANPKLKMVIVKTPTPATVTAPTARMVTPKTEGALDTTERYLEECLKQECEQAGDGAGAKAKPVIYICDLCGIGYIVKSMLRDHLREDHGADLQSSPSQPASCLECGKTLASRSSLRFHEMFVHGQREKTHACGVCGKLFFMPSLLSRHMERHAAARKFVCRVCRVGFASREGFAQHQATHSAQRPHACSLCSARFKHQRNLRAHLGSVHGVDKPGRPAFECALCELKKAFASERSLLEHMAATHDNARPFQCDACDETFFHYQALYRHKQKGHQEQARPADDDDDDYDDEEEEEFACDKCSLFFEDAAALAEHKSADPSCACADPGVPAFACDYCEAACASADLLQAHGETQHSLRVIEGQHFFTCAQCNLSFLDFDVFAGHAEEHDADADADDENVTYKCDVCGAIFLNYKGIVAHVKKAHPGCKIANLPCNKCDASFVNRTALRDHRRACHPTAAARAAQNGAGDYECSEPGCAKVYGTAHGVSQHIKKFHQRDRSLKFPCELCDKTFTTVYSRASHMSTHTGELNHPCGLCDKAFRLGSSLKEHLLTHTDLMPEECYICGKRFRKKTALRTHLRVHTGERPYPCEICGRRFRQSGDRNKHRNNVHRLTINMKFD